MTTQSGCTKRGQGVVKALAFAFQAGNAPAQPETVTRSVTTKSAQLVRAIFAGYFTFHANRSRAIARMTK